VQPVPVPGAALLFVAGPVMAAVIQCFPRRQKITELLLSFLAD
jgi:hypothetical protein